ncbi:MAG TPA: hypothetical protein PKK68_05040 [Methanothrix soehngenii]|nr:hypothetical protein [Methanothrix soehngenii]
MQHPHALHEGLGQDVAVSPDALLRAGGGKSKCPEGVIFRPLRGAQGQGPHSRRELLLQPEKSHISGFYRPPPLDDHLSLCSRSVCPEDDLHVLSGSALFRSGLLMDDMGAGDSQAFGYHKSRPCRSPSVGAEDPDDAAGQICIHLLFFIEAFHSSISGSL